MEDYILKLLNITKDFPGVKALSDVNMNVKRGEIHALVGENGAGKSTLMKILSGIYPVGDYEGQFEFEGEIQHFNNIKESEKAGVAIIYQELALVKYMTIAENIYLGNEFKKNKLAIDWDKTLTSASKLLADVGLDLDPTMPVVQLGIGQQQLVEIAKAISKNASLLILDEPTAALTEAEIDQLFGILRSLQQKGVTCIFISHKLSEVFKIADRVTIIRDGKWISTDEVSQLTEDDIITRMVGRELSERYPRVAHAQGDVVLDVSDWTVRHPEVEGRYLVKDVNFKLHKGEIVGLAGLMGAGRTELAMSLFGCFGKLTSGEMLLDGQKKFFKIPNEAINNGFCYVSEDRKKYGLNLKQDIQDNMAVASLEKISTMGIIDNSAKISQTLKYIKELNIKTPSYEQMVSNLSGGNQQKVVLGKWLLTDPKVLVMDEPTRGIDVGAKFEIYNIMNDLISQGVCVLMISSELPEILGMSDRILVMHNGSITGEMTAEEASQEKIIFHATGGK